MIVVIILSSDIHGLGRTAEPPFHGGESGSIRLGSATAQIAKSVGNPGAVEQWQWLCGFYPGSNPGEQRGGTADDFNQARAAFEIAWRIFSASRTEADYQAWREQRDWTARKYALRDRGEPVPLR